MITSLTVGQYQDLMSINQDMDVYDRARVEVSIITGKTIKEVGQMNLNEFNAVRSQFTADNIRKVLSEYTKKINHKITLPSGTYHLQTDYNKMRWGQLQDCVRHYSEYQGRHIEGLHKNIAILCCQKQMDFSVSANKWLPKVSLYRYEYSGDEVEKRVNECRHVPIVDVYGAYVFFWNLWNVWLQITPLYLQQGMEQATAQIQDILTRNSDGGPSTKR